MVTMATVITAFLYWRCSCFLSSDVLICEVKVQINAGAQQILLIWEGVGLGVDIKALHICVEIKNYIIKLFLLCDCKVRLFTAATAFMFYVPLRDTYGMYQYISHNSYSSLLKLV